MSLLTTSEPSGVALSPEQRAELVVLPLERDSLALRTTRNMATGKDSLQIPMLTEDVPVDFVGEGQELPTGEPVVNEATLVPKKIAALTVISSELAEDSEPAAVELIGQSIARSIRLKLDTGFLFAASGGLPSPGILTGDNYTDGGALGNNLDSISDAITSVEAAGGRADVIVMSPATWGKLSKLKVLATDSNQPLLGVGESGVNQAQQRTLFGIPVYVDYAVAAEVVAVWDSSSIATALRRDVKIDTDTSRYFDSDSVGIRATLRCDWRVLDPKRLIRLDAASA